MGRDELEASLAEEVRTLAGLDLEALRALWRERVGPPPSLRSHDHLRRLLAWRLQALTLGGLDRDTRRELAQTSRPGAPVGSRLMREWKGQAHEVEVTDAGVLYRGQCFQSLSEVARAITGVRWNGPRFFGLRQGRTE